MSGVNLVCAYWIIDRFDDLNDRGPKKKLKRRVQVSVTDVELFESVTQFSLTVKQVRQNWTADFDLCSLFID